MRGSIAKDEEATFIILPQREFQKWLITITITINLKIKVQMRATAVAFDLTAPALIVWYDTILDGRCCCDG
jgi:hypothetical protein